MICKTTYIFMINFLFCTVIPLGASKVDQTHKYDDFFKSDTDISNDTVQCFDLNKWCQQYYLQQLWIPWPTAEDALVSV